ncbi:hypothetical protein QE152_g21982 [Popillia japonica]|uniref:Uncharacterized protein n=1 Tax=Popillia japonica TaxID=7064 RepID=A0AAW1KMA5_POPJA
MKKREVVTGEVFTFHNYIYFEIEQSGSVREKTKRFVRLLDKARFTSKLKDHFLQSVTGISPNEFIKVICKINRDSTVSVAEEYRSVPHWWNGDIENKRKKWRSLRRILT